MNRQFARPLTMIGVLALLLCVSCGGSGSGGGSASGGGASSGVGTGTAQTDARLVADTDTGILVPNGWVSESSMTGQVDCHDGLTEVTKWHDAAGLYYVAYSTYHFTCQTYDTPASEWLRSQDGISQKTIGQPKPTDASFAFTGGKCQPSYARMVGDAGATDPKQVRNSSLLEVCLPPALVGMEISVLNSMKPVS